MWKPAAGLQPGAGLNGDRMPDRKHPARFLRWFGRAFVGVAAVLFLWISLPQIVRYVDVKSWKAVPCRIDSSEVVRNAQPPLNRRIAQTTFAPRIVYRYTVRDRIYESDSYRPYAATGSPAWAKRIADSFVPGMEATCYYNPRDPGRAVLDRTPDRAGRILIFVPFLFAGFGFLVSKLADVAEKQKTSR